MAEWYNVLRATDGTLFLIRDVESMNFESPSEEQRLIDTLSGKNLLHIRLHSGREHIVVLDDMASPSKVCKEIKDDIIRSWVDYARRK